MGYDDKTPEELYVLYTLAKAEYWVLDKKLKEANKEMDALRNTLGANLYRMRMLDVAKQLGASDVKATSLLSSILVEIATKGNATVLCKAIMPLSVRDIKGKDFQHVLVGNGTTEFQLLWDGHPAIQIWLGNDKKRRTQFLNLVGGKDAKEAPDAIRLHFHADGVTFSTICGSSIHGTVAGLNDEQLQVQKNTLNDILAEVTEVLENATLDVSSLNLG